MAFWNWSKTSATNQTADPTIYLAEGQAPASLNDASRSMMAALASFRDDSSGLLVTTNTSTNYQLASNSGFASTPNDGQLISFTVHTTNGTSPNLQVDAGNNYPIQSAPGVAIPANVLISGTPYSAKFNLSANAWVLRNFYGNPFIAPIGAIFPYVGATAPNSSYAFVNGQAISRTTYSVLFGLISTTFGVGDGTTTFNLPNLQGRSLFGVDTMGGAAATNLITVAGGNFNGATLGGTGGGQNVTIAKVNLPNYNLTVTDPGHTHTYQNPGASGSPSNGAGSAGGTSNTGSAVTGISVALGGSSTPLASLPPAMVLPFVIRII